MKSSIDMFGDEFLRDPSKPQRLTIHVHSWGEYHECSNYVPPADSPLRYHYEVRLDGTRLGHYGWVQSEHEARAAAEAYKAELLAHFRAGGE